ncbi:bifunctional UDP-sugar hydrolase/5'-nucleotidase [Sporosarcina saromensis]|uniref:Bifunctional UDP-sugar hydrolase/5'-nucleotidase n=1 Tax=Sporosarcina saromensis TaxID=359365 RepID=A0ABU4G995_9BACL|nr:bifunctional UDP-sugar hydrolase/5'-nucleotidase [Sporosarcina saromensis]MDW0113540.1 bifunctional UDP-sugar hydrolase/5'-nucleotidase [Sporosarcina saromensis]
MEQFVEKIHIYHTNDLHSHFESWPQISRYLLTQQAIHANASETSFRFDIGDHVDRSHPFTEGTAGKGNVALLNSAGYDAVTIGNNEGITLSKNALNTLYEGADFDVILCNLVETDGSIPKWMKLYKIYSTVEGTRVGVIGATAMYTDFYSKLGWHIHEPHAALKAVVEKIRHEVDILICLSHLGVNEDRLLAEVCPEIDVILGAHTHHLFPEGELVHHSLLAATGKFGQYVGRVTLEVDTKSNRLLKKEATVIPVGDLASGKDDVHEVNGLLNAGQIALDEKVFFIETPLKQQLFANSSLATFFGQALLAYTHADCAMFNAGIFLRSLEQGWVTKRHLHELLPHPINVCVVTLRGEELLRVYHTAQNEQWPQLEIKGLGFRGTLMGNMIFEQLAMNGDGHLLVGSEIVQTDHIYRLATLDMFTFGYFFPMLKDVEKEYVMPELIRDIMAWYGKREMMESLGLLEENE